MSLTHCACGICRPCLHDKMFRSMDGLSGQERDEILSYQLDLLQDPEHRQDSIEYCIECLNYLLRTEQHESSQRFIRKFLLPRKIMTSTIVWLVYKSFRADAGTPTHFRQGLPWDIGYSLSALSDHGVSFCDIIEMYDLPGWVDRFDWIILARLRRGELTRMKVSAPARLPDHFWTAIEATWILLDADAELALESLHHRAQDGYGFAKNVSAIGLALEAVRNFVPVESTVLPSNDGFVLCCTGAGGR
jgi:hypothetical protein